jgi:hypothetical protein
MCAHVYGDDMKKAPFLLIAYFVWASETRVDAYLDPGSGSMLVQVLLGGVAGAAVVMKLGWERFKDVFRSSKTKPTDPNA